MKATQKQIIIIVSVVVLVLIISFWLTYRSGKRSESNSPSNIKITDDIVGTNVLSSNEKEELKSLAMSLYNDMNGVNWYWEDNLYMEAVLLSDSELAALSNIFNAMYEKDNETLYQFLKNENFAWNSLSLSTEVDVLLNRMRAIGIS